MYFYAEQLLPRSMVSYSCLAFSRSCRILCMPIVCFPPRPSADLKLRGPLEGPTIFTLRETPPGGMMRREEKKHTMPTLIAIIYVSARNLVAPHAIFILI